MRKNLLLASVFCLSSLMGWAQTSFDKALSAVSGDNAYTVEGENPDSVFWTYTPSEDCLGYVKSSTSGSIDVYRKVNGKMTLLKGARAYPTIIYPMKKDEPTYFATYGRGEMGFNLATKVVSGLGSGLAKDNPLTIELDTVQFIGNDTVSQYSYDNYDMYATYTPQKDGQLEITTKTYISNVTADGVKIESSYDADYNNVYKIPVTAGKATRIVFNTSNPFLFSAKMTYPTPGSLDMPFELKAGDNTVPAEFGTYYYTYNVESVGTMRISSDEELVGGRVSIYANKSNITYNYTVAQSAIGSFNVNTELNKMAQGSTYYIAVSKTETTENAQTFKMEFEKFKQGETEDDPLVISEVPSELTLPSGQGTYYYSLNVPARTNKKLLVKALKEIGNKESTRVAIYPQQFSYGAVSGTDSVRYNVSGTDDKTYIIRWIANETEAVKFSVSYEDINEGEVITMPKTAVAGENKIEGTGTWYYKYQATRTGKLAITIPNDNAEMTVAFPRGTGQYDGEYESVLSGFTYSIAATKGTEYLITISNANKDDVFTLTEADYEVGESREKPIMVTNDKYAIESAKAGNTWLAYEVKKEGVLEIACDADYDYQSNVSAGKSTASYLSSLMTSEQVDGDYITKYAGSIRVAKGDTVLVHLELRNSLELDGKTVTFNLRDYNPGEAFSNPLELVDGAEVTIPVSSYEYPTWCKMKFDKPSKFIFTLKTSISAYLYQGKENAEADKGRGLSSEKEYDESWNMTCTITDSIQAGEEGEYYIKFVGNFEAATMNVQIIPAVVDAINTVNTTANFRVAGRSLIVGADADVKVYSLNGQKIAEKNAQGVINLSKGMYIVKVNGLTQKIIVK